jgi:hypothetical protein
MKQHQQRPIDLLLANHERDLAELLSLVGISGEIQPRMEELVDRCTANVRELMDCLERERSQAVVPEETKTSLAQLMRLHALTTDAMAQEQERLAREIQQAQQLRRHLRHAQDQEPPGGSCDVQG